MSAQPVGLDAAISRIQQIQSYQQQLVDPASASAQTVSSPGTATVTNSAGTASPAAPDFAGVLAALEQGQGQGAASTLSGTGLGQVSSVSDLSALSTLAAANPSLAGALGGATGAPGTIAVTSSSDAPAAVQAMTGQADALLGKPYVWGGGHSGWGEQTGYDCSGFVSKVLHAGGFLSSPQDTQTLPAQAGIESGPGQYVTIYDRTDAGSGQDHVIIDLNGQFYESGGESAAWGGGGGVEKIDRPSAGYLASFNQILHPAGL